MRRFFISILLVLATSLSFAQEPKATIVYIFDPLCGWCYTFNPVMEKLYAKYKHKLDFTVISGGMITGKRVRPISEMEEFILSGYVDMENLTGVKFGTPYIQMVKNGVEMLDSEKPSFAVCAFRDIYPEKSVDFARDLQKAHFLRGLSFNEDSTYLHVANAYHINGQEFLRRMASDSVKAETKEDFKKVEDAGISGFPTLLLRIKGKTLLITEGFQTYDKLEKKIDKLLKDS